VQDFRQLRVWSDAVDLSIVLYRTTEGFDITERFGLTSQIRRAAVSVAANIAEGAGSQHPRDFARFLGYSISSLCEIESHIEIASRLGLIAPEEFRATIADTTMLRKRLIRLHSSVFNESTGGPSLSSPGQHP
jgi:four helix bundle protein